MTKYSDLLKRLAQSKEELREMTKGTKELEEEFAEYEQKVLSLKKLLEKHEEEIEQLTAGRDTVRASLKEAKKKVKNLKKQSRQREAAQRDEKEDMEQYEKLVTFIHYCTNLHFSMTQHKAKISTLFACFFFSV